MKGGRPGLCRNILCLWLPHHSASSSQKTLLSRMGWYMTPLAGEVRGISVEYINWCHAEIRCPPTGPFSSRRILPMTRTLRSLPKCGGQSEASQRNHIKRTWYGPEGFPCSFANLVSLHLSRRRKCIRPHKKQHSPYPPGHSSFSGMRSSYLCISRPSGEPSRARYSPHWVL